MVSLLVMRKQKKHCENLISLLPRMKMVLEKHVVMVMGQSGVGQIYFGIFLFVLFCIYRLVLLYSGTERN